MKTIKFFLKLLLTACVIFLTTSLWAEKAAWERSRDAARESRKHRKREQGLQNLRDQRYKAGKEQRESYRRRQQQKQRKLYKKQKIQRFKALCAGLRKEGNKSRRDSRRVQDLLGWAPPGVAQSYWNGMMRKNRIAWYGRRCPLTKSQMNVLNGRRRFSSRRRYQQLETAEERRKRYERYEQMRKAERGEKKRISDMRKLGRKDYGFKEEYLILHVRGKNPVPRRLTRGVLFPAKNPPFYQPARKLPKSFSKRQSSLRKRDRKMIGKRNYPKARTRYSTMDRIFHDFSSQKYNGRRYLVRRHIIITGKISGKYPDVFERVIYFDKPDTRGLQRTVRILDFYRCGTGRLNRRCKVAEYTYKNNRLLDLHWGIKK